jgi:hypothetical protein
MADSTSARKARLDLAVPGILIGSIMIWVLVAILAVKFL